MASGRRPSRAWTKTTGPTSAPWSLADLAWSERTLAAFRRAYDEGRGSIHALADAFDFCQGQGPVPAWLSTAMLAELRRLSRFSRRDVIDVVRAGEVEDGRVHGLTWQDAYDYASEVLDPTPARGTAATMKRSWALVQARGRRQPGRYYDTPAFGRARARLAPPLAHVLAVIARYQSRRSVPLKE